VNEKMERGYHREEEVRSRGCDYNVEEASENGTELQKIRDDTEARDDKAAQDHSAATYPHLTRRWGG
jgi:hypothetical protein